MNNQDKEDMLHTVSICTAKILAISVEYLKRYYLGQHVLLHFCSDRHVVHVPAQVTCMMYIKERDDLVEHATIEFEGTIESLLSPNFSNIEALKVTTQASDDAPALLVYHDYFTYYIEPSHEQRAMQRIFIDEAVSFIPMSISEDKALFLSSEIAAKILKKFNISTFELGVVPEAQPIIKHKALELLTASKTACTNGTYTIYRTDLDTYRIWKEGGFNRVGASGTFIDIAAHEEELKAIAERENFQLFTEEWSERTYDL